MENKGSLAANVDVNEAVSEQRQWFNVALSSIGDAVITTDAGGRITFLNPVAESLTGWSLSEAQGLALSEVFKIINEDTRREVENPALRVERGRCVETFESYTPGE